MYERLIRDIKKALYKTLGKSTLVFSQLEVVVMEHREAAEQSATDVCGERWRRRSSLNSKRCDVGRERSYT